MGENIASGDMKTLLKELKITKTVVYSLTGCHAFICTWVFKSSTSLLNRLANTVIVARNGPLYTYIDISLKKDVST